MKVAPLHYQFSKFSDIESRIVHTGQHYDEQMSDVFFKDLDLPKPDYFLGIGGGSHTQQTANCMLAFEKVLIQEKPDLVIVVGDVNSTLACALVAVKEQIPVVHVEAGLRSGDRTMPEEINRILTDSISDQLFITEQSGVDNLKQENIQEEKIHLVGNVMIDCLIHYKKLGLPDFLKKWKLPSKSYVLMTMHRPSNVDTLSGLRNVVDLIKKIAIDATIIFPVHPRTLKNFEDFKLIHELNKITNLILTGPKGYLEFIYLLENASAVITDSGGIQEETTLLQVPCITFRNNTERPVTVEMGTNYLLGDLNPDSVIILLKTILKGEGKKGIIPPLWDGRAAERIVKILRKKYI